MSAFFDRHLWQRSRLISSRTTKDSPSPAASAAELSTEE
jgi:hypothetical protein